MKLEYTPNVSSGLSDVLVIDMESKPYQLVRGSMQGFGGIDYQHMSNQSPYQNGGSYFFSRSNIRTVSFQFRIYANSYDDMQEHKLHISRLLSSAYGEGVLRIYTNIANTKYYDLAVVPDGNPSMFSMISNAPDTVCTCNVNLTAFNPFWVNPAGNEVTFDTFEGGFQIPFTYPFSLGTSGHAVVSNSGSVPTPCTIILTGNYVNPVLTNNRTGESIKVVTALGNGESLVIDTNPQTSSVTHISSSGIRTSMFNAVSSDSSFWQLQPGNNDIICTDAGGTMSLPVTIQWYDRYAGVY